MRGVYRPPPDGYYRCSECGRLAADDPEKSYWDQAACYDEDCDGQMHCSRWDGWYDVEALPSPAARIIGAIGAVLFLIVCMMLYAFL